MLYVLVQVLLFDFKISTITVRAVICIQVRTYSYSHMYKSRVVYKYARLTKKYQKDMYLTSMHVKQSKLNQTCEVVVVEMTRN